eukprot:gnl/Spiro4/17991_TR9599_c0_g1_i1.p1 gnl/Spiro4/17991_TR9599_c0_g1~~gnl/Spiro4/17991_TR9599_c0_g1_i1.p1  ORF type:complete len:400 (+),score=91.56 gnl/Spiro4/17991_TR9599_c0_g1_i1:123-1322(+)
MRVVEVCVVLCAVFALRVVRAEPPHKIVINGKFDDWLKSDITIYTDPEDAEDGSVTQDGIPDCHDTDHKLPRDTPAHVFNGDFDLLRFAITHDEENVYAYLMARGDISRTSQVGKDGQTTAGRSYIQVAMDIDNDYSTGYCLCEGGYYPNACGYDIQFELEMYNGTFNTAHYLLHAMVNESQLTEARFLAIHKGEVFLAPAHYDLYTEWVYYDPNTITPEERARCTDGPHTLPNGAAICFVADKANGPFSGIMDHAFDEARHQVEIKAPYRGFLNRNGKPVLGLGQKVTVVMMLEGSGEYSSPNSWCTDAAYPIRGYVFEPPPPAPALPQSTAQPQKQPQQTRPAAEELARLFFHSIGELMKNPVFVCLMITTALLMILHAVGSKQSRTTVASSNSAAV